MANAAATPVVLCRLDELQDPGSRGLTLQQGGQPLDVMVVRKGCAVYAYVNSCPHTGSPLDWVEHEFLSLDKQHIQCAMHAALFRLADGMCVAGPCVGTSLTAIAVKVESGLVIIAPESPAVDVC